MARIPCRQYNSNRKYLQYAIKNICQKVLPPHAEKNLGTIKQKAAHRQLYFLYIEHRVCHITIARAPRPPVPFVRGRKCRSMRNRGKVVDVGWRQTEQTSFRTYWSSIQKVWLPRLINRHCVRRTQVVPQPPCHLSLPTSPNTIWAGGVLNIWYNMFCRWQHDHVLSCRAATVSDTFLVTTSLILPVLLSYRPWGRHESMLYLHYC